MLNLAYSLEIDFENEVVADLIIFESIRLSIGCLADVDVILTILPQLFAFIMGRTSFVSVNIFFKFLLNAFISCSSLTSSKVPWSGPPQLFTKISILLLLETANLNNFTTPSFVDKSTFKE